MFTKVCLACINYLEISLFVHYPLTVWSHIFTGSSQGGKVISLILGDISWTFKPVKMALVADTALNHHSLIHSCTFKPMFAFLHEQCPKSLKEESFFACQFCLFQGRGPRSYEILDPGSTPGTWSNLDRLDFISTEGPPPSHHPPLQVLYSPQSIQGNWACFFRHLDAISFDISFSIVLPSTKSWTKSSQYPDTGNDWK